MNRATWCFFSRYLLAFCVGEFDFVQAYTKGRVAVRVYTPPGKKALGTFSLDAAVRSLDFYDDFFGVPYPLPKVSAKMEWFRSDSFFGTVAASVEFLDCFVLVT